MGELYQAVDGDLIFHCEGDWLFDPIDFIPSALAVLNADPQVSQVFVRRADCFLTRGIDLQSVDFENGSAGNVPYK